jgi:nuclear pore complex protein Nup121
LYNKPGQFPIVHLKKTEIKNLPKRLLSSSSVRIAPPKKSMFQTSVTRMGSLISTASIIMSSSSSSVQKPLEVAVTSLDSDKNQNDNEPLTPTTETSNTKSALEALKEISRKRINSEELDVDRYKKQCKDLSEVDGPSEGSSKIDVVTPVASKRGRETNTATRSNSAEQLQKKLCTKSNDILSSLSSSCIPKRTGKKNYFAAHSFKILTFFLFFQNKTVSKLLLQQLVLSQCIPHSRPN